MHHHLMTWLLDFGKLSLVSGSNLLPPRPLLLHQRISPLLRLGPVKCGSVGVILFKLGLPVVERDKVPTAAGVDVHVWFELPRAVESAGDNVGDQRAGVGVVAPDVAAAEGALGDGLADFGLRGDGDEDGIVDSVAGGSRLGVGGIVVVVVVICGKGDSRGGGGVCEVCEGGENTAYGAGRRRRR